MHTTNSILITNAKVVNENEIKELDVFINKGRIENISGDLSKKSADVTIDAAGKYLIPGMIDDQVHFRDPGLTHKGDIYTESRAAVAGGITSFMEMPNTNPQTLDKKALGAKWQTAAKQSIANYSFYLGASNSNLEQVKAVDPKTVCGLKVFMGSSTGDMLVDKPKALEAIFKNAPILVATHCEDTPTILANEAIYREKYGEGVPMKYHPKIRSAQACYDSTSLAVNLAKKHGTKLHVLHISTKKELSLFSKLPLDKKHITAEACVHHLFFNDTAYLDKSSLVKCNPAIKSEANRKAIVDAVITGKIDVIATDHAPHTLEEKRNNYFKAPSGLPLVQHALLSLLDFYHDSVFSLELIVNKTSHRVADLFQIENRGYIREGYWADLVLLNDNPYTVTKDNILYKCGWSPFENHTFKSSIDTTIVSGNIAYQNGWVDARVLGKRLKFDR